MCRKGLLTITFVILLTAIQAQDADLSSRVGKAIDKGVVWLKKYQEKDGSWDPVKDAKDVKTYSGGKDELYRYQPGFTALSLVALLKSDVSPSDPVIKKGFEYIDKYLSDSKSKICNYDMGVILMAIEAKYAAERAQKDKKAGVQPKGKVGDWKEPKYSIGASDRKLADSLVKDLLASQSKKGGWRYGNRGVSADAGDEDISATQIVLLGLKSATRMGITVNKNVFKKALDYILGGQEKDGPQVVMGGGNAEGNVEAGGGGSKTDAFIPQKADKERGWCYMPGDNDTKGDRALYTKVSGSMTTAGITGLIVCKSVLSATLKKDELKKLDQAIYDGIAWICSNYTVKKNPGPGGWRSTYYYLYGLERVGILGNFEAYGNNYWYKDCAEVLCDQQKEDGQWYNNSEITNGGVVDTAFALLVLRRGTVPMGPVLTPR